MASVRTSRSALHVLSVATLVVLVAASVGFQIANPDSTPGGSVAKLLLPEGRQVYSVAQAAGAWPKIVETRIDPLDVHVGWTQTLEVVVQGPEPITRVTAIIEHDKGTDTVELAYVEQVTALEGGEPLRVAADGTVLFPGSDAYALVEKAHADDDYPKYLYRGTWVVHDTHDTTYATTFVAEDGSGGTNEVVMAWSDACGIPTGGNFTLSSPCTISAADGVDNGILTINSSLTLNANFAYNSGYSMSIGTGSISVCGSCQILQTNIWQIDADADGFPLNSTMYLQSSAPTNGRRRYLMQTAIDCNDNVYSASNTCGSGAVLVAHWKFDEGSGTTVTDYSSYGHTGTLSGNKSAWVTGYLGSAFDFESYNMSVADNSTMSITGDLTVNFWWYASACSTCHTHAIEQGNYDAGGVEWGLEFEGGDVVSGYGGSSSGWGIVAESGHADSYWLEPNANSGSWTIYPNGWYMITVVHEGTVGRLYQNGQLLYTTNNGQTYSTTYPYAFRLGPFNQSVLIDEFRIYNGALNQTEINDLYNNP